MKQPNILAITGLWLLLLAVALAGAMVAFPALAGW
jgi:hypothetical protein